MLFRSHRCKSDTALAEAVPPRPVEKIGLLPEPGSELLACTHPYLASAFVAWVVHQTPAKTRRTLDRKGPTRQRKRARVQAQSDLEELCTWVERTLADGDEA